MKTIIIFLLTGFITIQCVADDAEFELMIFGEAMRFAAALDTPTTNTNSTVWTEPLFPTTGIITTNLFIFEKFGGNSTALSPLKFYVYSNNVNVAFGNLFEYTSFELARNAFMIQIVNCNMTPEQLAVDYEILSSGVGDFRIAVKQGLYFKSGEIHFVRGGKSISLYPKGNVNIQPIAETLDALLMSPP